MYSHFILVDPYFRERKTPSFARRLSN